MSMEELKSKYIKRNKSVENTLTLKDLLEQQKKIRLRDEKEYKKLKEKMEVFILSNTFKVR